MKHRKKKKQPMPTTLKLGAMVGFGAYAFVMFAFVTGDFKEPEQVSIADIITEEDDTQPVELYSAKDALIDYVMHEIEGGSKYVKDGCGYAKYGINSCYNKDVNVKKLTAHKAAKIYVERYWDERLDSYQPAFQLVAFDALVNHGKDSKTWEMIEAAKGSPAKLIKLRKAYYKTLPNYKEHKAGWNSRMQKLTSYQLASK